ncbi:hypothetical protein [Streptomyces griseofuscus]|uniref:hypothetical protein n=1 Tax=Streptomyces griseofuscus TaxID=146922 RepID=UPI0036A4333E
MSGTNLAQDIKALFDSIPVVEWPRHESCLNGSWWGIDVQLSMAANERVRLVRLRRSSLGRPEVSV